MELFETTEWTDYELIDSGNYEKLERFGPYFLRRPEPQALWRPALTQQEWVKNVHAWFVKTEASEATDPSDRGTWVVRGDMPKEWAVSYDDGTMSFRFRLERMESKHVGVFPEQAANWQYIHRAVRGAIALGTPGPVRVLNLFAYTGGASMAARAAGAEVVHVDAVDRVVRWARENMTGSDLGRARWITDDAVKFLRREARRGSTYRGVVLDPPAYGRGPAGEKWLLSRDLPKLLVDLREVFDPSQGFLVLNLYSLGYSPLVAENLVKDCFPEANRLEVGELYAPDASGRRLPMGVFARFNNAL
jgi:23S rRNA (cytosine1962-C5)-methyltransferase